MWANQQSGRKWATKNSKHSEFKPNFCWEILVSNRSNRTASIAWILLIWFPKGGNTYWQDKHILRICFSGWSGMAYSIHLNHRLLSLLPLSFLSCLLAHWYIWPMLEFQASCFHGISALVKQNKWMWVPASRQGAMSNSHILNECSNRWGRARKLLLPLTMLCSKDAAFIRAKWKAGQLIMHEAVLHGFLSEASSPSLYFAWGTFLLNTQLLLLLQNVEAKTGKCFCAVLLCRKPGCTD